MKSKLCVIYSTAKDDDFISSYNEIIKQTSGVEDIFIIPIKNQKLYSLTQAYNLGLDEFDIHTDNDDSEWIIAFQHDDITHKTKDWGKKILYTFNKNKNYGIIGVAGTDVLNNHMCWWLNEQGNAMNTTHMFGRVFHTNGIREYESIYSEKINNIKPVVCIDGVLMFVDPSTFVQSFDERIDDYHFYDISFCVANFISDIKIGVIDTISILHNSQGQTNQKWEENRLKTIQIYHKYLPLNI